MAPNKHTEIDSKQSSFSEHQALNQANFRTFDTAKLEVASTNHAKHAILKRVLKEGWRRYWGSFNHSK